MANEIGEVRAFKVFRDPLLVREQLHINSKIQGILSKKIQTEIRAIKEDLKPPDRRETPKSKPIPPQNGFNRIAKKATKEDSQSTMAVLINSVESLNVVGTFSDKNTSSDEDNDRMS